MHRPPPPSASPTAAPTPAAAGPAERVVTMTTRGATATATRRWCSPPLPLGRRRLVPDRRPAAASTMHSRPIHARRRAPPPRPPADYLPPTAPATRRGRRSGVERSEGRSCCRRIAKIKRAAGDAM
jgi:hypothetical protein